MTNPIFASADAQQLLLSTLRVIGVTHVSVSFSGSGDSGNVDEAYAVGANNQAIDLHEHSITWPKVVSETTLKNHVWVTSRKVVPTTMSLNDILTTLCETALDHSQIDWYNNDGGQGSFEIDMTNEVPAITLNVGVNVVQTEDHTFEFYEPMTEEEADAPVPSQS